MSLIWIALAAAHPLSPSSVTVVEGPDHTVEMVWRHPANTPVASPVRLKVDGCTPTSGERSTREPEAQRISQSWQCEGPLTGRRIEAVGAKQSPTDLLVTVERPGQPPWRTLLGPNTPDADIPAPEAPSSPWSRFFLLGVDHLLTGTDHVAFVVGLTVLLQRARSLLIALSAFTVGHAITLACVSLGWLPEWSAPVEWGIAASIVWLGLEILDPHQRTPLRRHPALLPLGIGLVHGMGFAGALAETGLPPDALLPALFSFHVGLELGQVGVLLVTAACLWAAQRAHIGWLPSALAWILGSVGMMWIWERTPSLF